MPNMEVELNTVMDSIIKNAKKALIEQVERGIVKKKHARERFIFLFGEDVDMPEEFLDDEDPKLPHDAEFEV